MKKTPDHKKIMAMENGLVPVFAKLSKMEKRFLAFCIAQLNPMTDKSLGQFEVNIADIAKVFDLAPTHTYKLMREAATSINSCPVFRIEGKAHKMDFWFYHLDWFPESGQIEIQFSKRLAPLLLELKNKGYVQHTLGMAKNFSNKGWTLYVILKQWLKAGSQEFELDELKALMGISGKYKRWAIFQSMVIEPAVKNINDFSDLKVSYDKIKKRRAVTGLLFTISRKETNFPKADIDIDNVEQRIHAVMTMAGMHEKTISRYINIARKHNRLHDLLKKSEQLFEKHQDKGQAKTVAISGSLKKYIADWGQLSLFESEKKESSKKEPSVIDSDAIRKCLIEKKDCEIRKTGQARAEMCWDCLALYPVPGLDNLFDVEP